MFFYRDKDSFKQSITKTYLQKLTYLSVQIPVYNPDKNYLKHCIQSVLNACDHARVQPDIVIYDDASEQTDSRSIANDLQQNYPVTYHIGEQNRGIGGAWNWCIEHAKHEIIHILHQDDYVLPWYYAYMLRPEFLNDDNVGAATCRTLFVDENGLWRSFSQLHRMSAGIMNNALKIIALKSAAITCPSILVKKSVYEHIGGYKTELTYMLDVEFYARLAYHYNIWFEPQSLVCYRSHSNSATGVLKQDASDTYDVCRGIDIASQYYPERQKEQWVKQSKKQRALKALNIASKAIDDKKYALARSQMKASLFCSTAPEVIKRYAKIYLKYYLK